MKRKSILEGNNVKIDEKEDTNIRNNEIILKVRNQKFMKKLYQILF